MTPSLRRLSLTAHITLSLGWLGAVVAFLALSIAALTSGDVEIARGAYLSMNVIGRYVIVPLSLAALASGLVESLGTEWGLFRYYWVVVKLVLTVFAVAALLLHQFTAVTRAAGLIAGASPGTVPTVVRPIGIQLAADSGLATLVLVSVAILGVYKPWGRIRARARDSQAVAAHSALPAGLKILLIIAGVLVVVFVVVHLAGGGLHHHAR